MVVLRLEAGSGTRASHVKQKHCNLISPVPLLGHWRMCDVT